MSVNSSRLSCSRNLSIIDLRSSIEKTILSLLEYCTREQWSGYDPFDGLNSRLFEKTGVFKNKWLRLCVTQGIKRLPINVRPLLLIEKSENPKACALFCSSLIRLIDTGLIDNESLIESRLATLLALRCSDYTEYCWGYNFDWQSKGFYLPKYKPNIICTTFAGNALIDAYERYGKERYLEGAVSAGEFLTRGLNIHEDENAMCFSYTPFDNSQIHNANLLGAAFIGRLFKITGSAYLRRIALKAMQFTICRQHEDGSWPYGEGTGQKWVDNFHTGYNLVALWRLFQITNDDSARNAVIKGLKFYLDRFFYDGVVPKYYPDRIWPIDIHSVAQSIITLCELSTLDDRMLSMAFSLYQWAFDSMRNNRGFFYYQKTKLMLNKISYMRWGQAWMLSALSVLIGHAK